MTQDKDKWRRVVRRAIDGTEWGEGPLALSNAVANAVERQLMEDIDKLFGPDLLVEAGILGYVRPRDSAQRKKAISELQDILAEAHGPGAPKSPEELRLHADQLLAMYEAMHGVKL